MIAKVSLTTRRGKELRANINKVAHVLVIHQGWLEHMLEQKPRYYLRHNGNSSVPSTNAAAAIHHYQTWFNLIRRVHNPPPGGVEVALLKFTGNEFNQKDPLPRWLRRLIDFVHFQHKEDITNAWDHRQELIENPRFGQRTIRQRFECFYQLFVGCIVYFILPGVVRRIWNGRLDLTDVSHPLYYYISWLWVAAVIYFFAEMHLCWM